MWKTPYEEEKTGRIFLNAPSNVVLAGTGDRLQVGLALSGGGEVVTACQRGVVREG